MRYICQNLFMNFLDIGIGILLVVGLVRGIKNGFFIEVASLIALIVGIYGAIHFSYIAGEYLAQYIDWKERTITIVAFVLTLLIIVFLIHLIGRFLTALVDFVLLGFLNKIAGGVFGVVQLAVILGTLLVFFERFVPSLTFINEATKQESFFYEPLQETGNLVFTYIPEVEKDPNKREAGTKEEKEETDENVDEN